MSAPTDKNPVTSEDRAAPKTAWQRLLRKMLRPGEIASALDARRQTLQRRFYRCPSGLPTVSLGQIAPSFPKMPPLIMDDICLPPYHGVNDHDDVVPLMRIVHHLNPRRVLEFGTAQGNTVANICRLCSAQVVTVNALPDQIGGDVITFALSKDEIGHVYRDYGFADRVLQVYCNTKEFDWTRVYDSPCVDLAIIDACHDTEYVLNDFLKVLPALSTQATVLFHDTHPSLAHHLAGSYRACLALRKQGFDVRYIPGTWWGIWRKEAIAGSD